jgi:hypothetical protein
MMEVLYKKTPTFPIINYSFFIQKKPTRGIGVFPVCL